MNIFLLDNDIKKCAEQHVDKHVVKMIVEYAQLLSTAHRVLDGDNNELPDDRDTILYKATHRNHPSAVWARESSENYVWLHALLKSLCEEYTFRYEKIHKTQRDGLMDTLGKAPNNIQSLGITEFKLAMPDEFKIEKDPVASYRNYYNGAKKDLFRWKKRDKPTWIVL